MASAKKEEEEFRPPRVACTSLSTCSTDIQRLICAQLDRESLHSLQCATSDFDSVIESHPINSTRVEGLHLTIKCNPAFLKFEISTPQKKCITLPTFFYPYEITYCINSSGNEEHVLNLPKRRKKVFNGCWKARFLSVLARYIRHVSFSQIDLLDFCLDPVSIQSLTSVLAKEKVDEMSIIRGFTNLSEVDRESIRRFIDSAVTRVLTARIDQVDELFPLEWIAKSSLSVLSLRGYPGTLDEASDELIEKISKSISFLVPRLLVNAANLASMIEKRLIVQADGQWEFTLVKHDGWATDDLIAAFNADPSRGNNAFRFNSKQIRIVNQRRGMNASYKEPPAGNVITHATIEFRVRALERLAFDSCGLDF